jgi:hypothetical protein
VLRRKLKLEKYALTKPLPPYKGTIKDGKTSQMLKEEETKHAKKEGRWKRLISRLSKS